MNVQAIAAKRTAAAAEMRTIHAAHPDGALPEGVAARWAALEADVAALGEAERRAAALDALDRAAAGNPLAGDPGSPDARFNELRSSVTLLDVVRAGLNLPDKGAGRARELSDEISRRTGRQPAEGGLHFDMARPAVEQRTFTGATGNGSALVQTTVSQSVIDRLREALVVRAAGATLLSGLSSNVQIPRLTASSTVAWIADNSPVTQSNPTFDAITLTPHTAAGITGISRSMLLQTNPEVTNLIEGDLARLMATAVDTVALIGGGANQPVGLLGNGSVPVTSGGTNGLAPSWANLQAMIGAVDAGNALTGSNLAFVGNAKIGKALRTTPKTVADTASNFLQSDPNTLAGFKYLSTQLMPSNGAKGSGTNLSSLLFGDWTALLVGMFETVTILVNPYDSTAYAAGTVLVRAMLSCDVGIRHLASFNACTDIIAP